MLREHFSIRPSPNRRAPSERPALHVHRDADDPQDGFGASHLAYLPARVSGHLPPFPMWTAFPSSESTAAPSPAPRGAVGDPTFPWCWTSRARRRCLVRPLDRTMSHRPPHRRFEQQRLCRPIMMTPPKTLCRGCTLASLETEVRQSGPHRIARPCRTDRRVFGPLPLRRHAKVPFHFRRRVSHWPGSCLPNLFFLREGSSTS